MKVGGMSDIYTNEKHYHALSCLKPVNFTVALLCAA